VHNLQRVCSQMCILVSKTKKHRCIIQTCPCTSAQITFSKVHTTPTANKMHIYIYTHTHAHACICTRTHTRIYDTAQHAETMTPKLTTYAQICKHIHIHMYIHAYKYIYTCTCIYIHTCTSVHIHTYTHIHTHIQHVHMHTDKHAWNESAAATTRGADADARSSARLLRSMQSTTFGTSNARTSLYPLPETAIPLNPPSPLPNIPQNSSRTATSAVLLFHTEIDNRVHDSEEAPCSFTMAPCVVVERLEGKQRCSRAPVGEHADAPARDYTMWLSTR